MKLSGCKFDRPVGFAISVGMTASSPYPSAYWLSHGARQAFVLAGTVQPLDVDQFMVARGVGGQGQRAMNTGDLAIAFSDVSAAQAAASNGKYAIENSRRAFQLSQLALELLQRISEQNQNSTQPTAQLPTPALF